MKYFVVVCCVFASLFIIPHGAKAQTSECRQLSGLPIPIGVPVICGQVKLRGLREKEARPTVHVSLVVGGVQADRMLANDSGYYYFLRSPGDGTMLLFEVSNAEVGRVVLSGGAGSSIRRDIEVDVSSLRANATPGVVSAQSFYTRDAAAEKAFTTAMAEAKAKRSDSAITLFKQITDKDPKDFVAWTELGTLYFSASKPTEAEAAYTRATELKPDFMPALMNLGKLHLSQKAYEKAAAIFFKAINADPNSADALQYLGETYLQLKQGSKAVIAFNEALRIAPVEKAEIHLRLATLYNSAGIKDKAALEYKLFLGKVPGYPEKEKLEKYIAENSK